MVLHERVATLEAFERVRRRPFNRQRVVQAAFGDAQFVESHVSAFLPKLFFELLGLRLLHLTLVFELQLSPFQPELGFALCRPLAFQRVVLRLQLAIFSSR